MGEDEFFDAVENALDKLEEEQNSYDKLKRFSVQESGEEDLTSPEVRKHPLWPIIDKVVMDGFQ